MFLFLLGFYFLRYYPSLDCVIIDQTNRHVFQCLRTIAKSFRPRRDLNTVSDMFLRKKKNWIVEKVYG